MNRPLFAACPVCALMITNATRAHFLPRERFSPDVGAGLTAGILFSEDPSGPIVTDLRASSNVGEAIKVGLDYDVSGP